MKSKKKPLFVGLGGVGGGGVLRNMPEEKWGRMGNNVGRKFSHKAYSFTSFQCPWALLPLFFVRPTKCTPLRVCVMCPSRSSRIPSESGCPRWLSKQMTLGFLLNLGKAVGWVGGWLGGLQGGRVRWDHTNHMIAQHGAELNPRLRLVLGFAKFLPPWWTTEYFYYLPPPISLHFPLLSPISPHFPPFSPILPHFSFGSGKLSG